MSAESPEPASRVTSPGDIELGAAGDAAPAPAPVPAGNMPVDQLKSKLEELAENREYPDLEALGGVPALAQLLSTDSAEGLNDSQVASNREKFGKNVMPDKPVKTLLQHFWESLDDLTLAILEVAGVVSIIFGVAISKTNGDWIQGLAILLAVIVVSSVTSFQNWTQDQQFAALSAVKDDRNVEVRRNGKDVDISIYDVVVGDLFRAKSGEVLPCDGVLVSGQNVKTDESAMTGESKAVSKSPHFPFMVGGSKLVSGDGRFIVTTVGEDTSYGRIVKHLQEEPEKDTPLQEKLETLALQIGYVGFVFGGLTTLILIIAYFASGRYEEAGEDGQPSIFIEVLRAVVLGITIVVVAVPEGLPLAVTISLAFSMKRMYADKCLVRELAACETMGSATCICSDKTGTLTENRMTVKRAVLLGKWVDHAPDSKEDVDGSEEAIQVIAHSCALNATARLEYPEDFGGKPKFLESPTEGCLLHMVKAAFGTDFDGMRHSATYRDSYYREPFSSERKRMTTVYKGVEKWHGEYVCFVKGASEIVLGEEIAEFWRAVDGSIHKLDDVVPEQYVASSGAAAGETMRALLLRRVDEMASSGYRTLGIGYRAMSASDLPAGHADSDARDQVMSTVLANGTLEAGLIISAVVGIEDPVRQGVPEAVQTCVDAGIRVRMCTGDNQKTAANIAKQCGILKVDGPGRVMLGKDFRALTEAQRLAALPGLDVLARSSPTDKLLLVKGLQHLGETVSVTGDGTNDAPALVAADIGLAMGIAGTEVAKEASKIVITDDRFTSIVTAVKWGRSVLENIRKFLQFQLTINIVALMVTIIVATTNEGDTSRFPINPVQLLWINLIMDSFAALALATEPPNDQLLTQRPVRREDKLMTNIMWRNMLGHSVVQVALLLWLSLDRTGSEVFLLNPDDHFQDELHYTCVFNAFVWLQITNKINCRKLHNEWNVFEGIFESTISLFIIFVIIAGQVFIVEVGGDITLTRNLGVEQWLICIAIGFISFPVGLALKFIPVPEDATSEPEAAPEAEAAPAGDAIIATPGAAAPAPGATSDKLVDSAPESQA